MWGGRAESLWKQQVEQTSNELTHRFPKGAQVLHLQPSVRKPLKNGEQVCSVMGLKFNVSGVGIYWKRK